jgi:hypothetical protein
MMLPARRRDGNPWRRLKSVSGAALESRWRTFA